MAEFAPTTGRANSHAFPASRPARGKSPAGAVTGHAAQLPATAQGSGATLPFPIELTGKGRRYAGLVLAARLGLSDGREAPDALRDRLAYALDALCDRQAALLAVLDELDDDADLEPDADGEPSLAGWAGGCDDCELDDVDAEWSLGWGIPTPTTIQEIGYTTAGWGGGEGDGDMPGGSVVAFAASAVRS